MIRGCGTSRRHLSGDIPEVCCAEVTEENVCDNQYAFTRGVSGALILSNVKLQGDEWGDWARLMKVTKVPRCFCGN